MTPLLARESLIIKLARALKPFSDEELSQLAEAIRREQLRRKVMKPKKTETMTRGMTSCEHDDGFGIGR